jgi:hypothetical protein
MFKRTFIITITCLTFFARSAKAELTDCIDILVPLGISHQQAEQACSKACKSSKNSNSRRELYRLCKAAQRGNGNALYYPNGEIMTSAFWLLSR